MELDKAIKSGFDGFKQFIEKQLHHDPNYLEDPFWMENGSQMMVVNYLIQLHKGKLPLDLTIFIDFILYKTKDKNAGEPLHQAFEMGQLQLGHHLLEHHHFDMERRDQEGRTLLSLALATKNPEVLKKVLANKPNVNAVTRNTKTRLPFQPLHEAIVLDFASGVRNLGRRGADLTNPFGVRKETPLLLAARLGKIKALAALLEFPIDQLNLEAENKKIGPNRKRGDNAMESLCRLLAQDKTNKELIFGIAMLFCRGAEPPRSKLMCQLLAEKRFELLQAIDKYLEKRAHLVEPFVARCHKAESPLYKIIYVEHSWKMGLRRLFGLPSEMALKIEHLVTRKYSQTEKEGSTSLKKEDSPMKLYAEFVRRYNERYCNEKMTNPWSAMRWMMAEGQCNWGIVQDYANRHQGSRTRIIYEEMFKDLPALESQESSEVNKSLLA